MVWKARRASTSWARIRRVSLRRPKGQAILEMGVVGDWWDHSFLPERKSIAVYSFDSFSLSENQKLTNCSHLRPLQLI